MAEITVTLTFRSDDLAAVRRTVHAHLDGWLGETTKAPQPGALLYYASAQLPDLHGEYSEMLAWREW